MLRGMILAVAVSAAALEPALPAGGGEFDLARYAITQGGLMCVVFVLLWSYRRDFTRVLAEQQERLRVMTDMVSASTAALTRSAEASDRMARAVENLERNR